MRRYLTRLLNPPEFPDEEQTRVATLLNFFIWAVIAILSLNAIALFIAAPEIDFTLWLNGLVIAFTFGLRWLMWQGKVNLAGFLLCLVFWGALAYYLATSGGLRSPALVDLGITVVMATILLGGRGAFAFGVISGITLLALYVGDVAGWLISHEAAPTESRLLASYLTFTGGMAVSAMIGAYSVSHTLAHSRQSKHQLAAQNHALQHEIAERKRVEEERMRLVSIVESTPDYVSIAGRDSVVNYINRGGRKLLGLPDDVDIAGTVIGDYHPPEVAKMLAEQALPAAAQSGIWTGETILLAHDGRQFPVSQIILAHRDDAGTVVYYSMIIRDLTERQRTEEALSANAERLRVALSALDLSVFNQDKDLRYTWMFQPQLGYTPDQVVGRTDAELLPREAAENVTRIKRSVLASNQGARQEVSVVLNDKVSFYDLIAYPLRDASGETVGITGATLDITERKRADEELRKLSHAVEQSPVSVVITNTQGDIEYVNPKVVEISGYDASELLGQNPRILQSGETPPDVYRQLWATITAGGEWRGEFRNKKKNGELYWEAASISPIKDANGKTTHYLGLKEDITERKAIEVALRQSEERFAKAFHVSPVGIVIVKLEDARIVDANASFLRMLGYSGEDVIGHRATDLNMLVGPITENEIAQMLLTRQSIRDLEVRFRTRSGEDHVALASIELVELGGESCVLALIDDITERIQAEVALRTSEARFRLLFENSPVGIAIVRNQNCLFANQTLGALFGTADSTELIGHPFCDHVAPDHRQEILRKLDDNAETLPISLDTYGLRQDGTHFRMHLYIGVIPLADGPAFIVFVVDLTDRIRLEEETLKAVALRVELDKEREVVELKDRFTSMVSHEFRTPLTVIRMSSELLEHFPDRFPEERKVKFLQDMQTQVRYMVQLLEDVLTIGKANAGKLAFNPRPVDARTFSQSLLEQLQLADSDQHRFVFLADGNLEPVHLDEQILRHILVNLVSNAIKYSPAGTEVSLEVVREADEVVFRVSDQGIGIPETDMAHLFEAFHRGKNTARVQGTGLGLAIVKANVETHGGTILCDSHVGVGTTFTVRLPVNPPAARPA